MSTTGSHRPVTALAAGGPEARVEPLTYARMPLPDDRRTCRQCCELAPGGECQAARRGDVPQVSRIYRPDPDLRHRCWGYQPQTADHDQRTGRDRWPGLMLEVDIGANTSHAQIPERSVAVSGDSRIPRRAVAADRRVESRQ
jgi:hypothetical protein